MMELRYQYRIYPTKEQECHFLQEIGNQRFVWNQFLAKEQEIYQKTSNFNFYNKNSAALKDLKKVYEFLKIGDSTALQQTLLSLDNSMKRCFKKIGEFPKFKKRKEFEGSFTIVSQIISSNKKQIKLPKIGWIKWNRHRPLPSIVKTVSIIQDGKHWCVSLVVKKQEKDLVELESAVGIDFNSKDFITSDGEVISNPKFLKQSKKILRRRQRQFAKTQKDSNRRKVKQLKLRNSYRKVRNQRKDFVHQTSSSIVKNYDLICLEDLNVKGMQKFNGTMIQDNCFSMLKDVLKYKCRLHGKHFVQINRFDPSSKACNACGNVKSDLSLSVRKYSCDHCGYGEDRDLNAALNIKEWGVAKYLNGTTGAVETRTYGSNGRGDTSIGVLGSKETSARYVSLNRQKFLSLTKESFDAEASGYFILS